MYKIFEVESFNLNIPVESMLFFQLTAILILASFIGFLAIKFKQPLIIAFILSGIIAGPDMLNIVSEQYQDVIETLAGFGITLLLFVVGLKLDLQLIRKMGSMVLVVGIVQISITLTLGVLLSLLLQFDFMASVLIGLALTFSSTIIVVKLLSDKRAIDSLYGRIALGILIIQDLAVILVAIVITALAGTGGEFSHHAGGINIFLPLKAFAIIVFVGLFIRYIANPITKFMSNNSEFMVISCISFAIAMAAICEYLGFGQELGGLLSGIALASTPYNNIIAARLSTLRDFLLLFFFAHLGSNMNLANIADQILPALVFSLFVLFVKPALVMIVMNFLKYRKRTGFMTGITISQISEFSLILMAMGLSSGFIDQGIMNLTILIGLITMGVSTYAISYGDNIHAFFANHIMSFKQENSTETSDKVEREYDVIIFGLGRYGSAMAKLFKEMGFNVLGVDFDPDAISKAKKTGILTIYGDAADPDFLIHLPLDNVKIVVFSFHHYMTGPFITDLRRTLAKSLREHGYSGRIAATSHNHEHDKDLHKHGIDITLSPFDDAALYGAKQIVEIIK